MPTYSYTAQVRASGQTVSGTIDVASQAACIDSLRERGMIVTGIKESRKAKTARSAKGKKRKKVGVEDLVIFARQLATIINAGLPLLEGLDILGEQMENASFQAVLKDVYKQVENGETLADSLEKHPKVFNSLFCNLVRAGEASGMLDEILRQLSIYLEKSAKLQRRIKSATIYPSVICCVAVAVVFVLMVWVIPVFQKIFEGFGAKLPAPTQFLINLSNWIKGNIPFIIGGSILSVFLFKRWIRTDSGRRKFDTTLLKLPIFGALFRKVAIAKFTRTFGTLLHSGVNILVALDIVSKTAGNKVVESAINDVRFSIREGESIAGPLRNSGVFPPMVVRMIDVGEKTGALDEMLGKIADFYEDQVDVAVAGLTSMMEPVIIVVLGVVVGGVVISMYLPMFKLPTIIKGKG